MHRILISFTLGYALLVVGPIVVAAQGSRPLAPGVMTIIPPDRDESDTFSGPREFVEILRSGKNLEWTPNYYPESDTLQQLSQSVVFRRNVWCLEFSFKPVRMAEVNVSNRDGTTSRKLIWYMVYRIRNTGFHLQPTPAPDEFGHERFTSAAVDHTVRFFPLFVLDSLEHRKSYLDRVMPEAVARIRAIEDPRIQFRNSVQISQSNIQRSTEDEDHSVWGIATWEGVDPRTSFFSVSVHGLTNAYRWETKQDEFQAGQPARSANVYERKVLQLNFWRPGDAVRQHQKEIRYGIPSIEDVQGKTITSADRLLQLYRVPESRDYAWLFR